MAPDVTFAWFIRHFTLSGELLLTASQISSCLLSSNCLWLTFSKILKQDDERWWRMCGYLTHYQGENYVRSAAFLWSHLCISLSAHRPSQGSNSWQKPVTRQENCQMITVSQETLQTCLLLARRKTSMELYQHFLWHHCLGVKDLLYGECWTSIYPAITRRQLGIIRW